MVCIKGSWPPERKRGLLPEGGGADSQVCLQDTWVTMGYGKQAGCTHPTGTHSSFQDVDDHLKRDLTRNDRTFPMMPMGTKIGK